MGMKEDGNKTCVCRRLNTMEITLWDFTNKDKKFIFDTAMGK